MTSRPILWAGLFCAAAAVVAPLIGSVPVSLGAAWAGVSPDAEILWLIRMPRVGLSLLAGGALAVAGLIFQSMLRDALATPYTLGVSAGASLGTVIAICLGLPLLWLSSLAGALAALLVVLAIASEGRRVSSFTLLLGGVTINSIAMALIMFLQSVTSAGRSMMVTRWLMGAIDTVAPEDLAVLGALTVPAAALLYRYGRDWNLMAVGEEWAASRGVPVTRRLILGYLLASLLAGAVTALTGPIGFIGLLVPHALRLRLGADHRVLLPASYLAGAGFLTVCDTAARMVLAPAEIPVGVLTALLGGPCFIAILRRRRGSQGPSA